MIGKFRKVFQLLSGMDWEYIIPMLFCHLKYKDRATRISALKHLKHAYFERRFSHIIEKYNRLASDLESDVNDGPVWLCWLQGESTMPDVVRACYKQLRSMVAQNRKVILITWDNLKEYADIPDYIINKVKQGIITYIHFSDIIRFTLLAEHGGLWIDSTVYVTSPIPESTYKKTYFSVRTEHGAETEYKYDGVNRGLWKCFIIGAVPKSIWLSCARDIIFEYWRRNDFFIDYFVVDYILLLIYDKIGNVRCRVNSCVELATHIYAIEKMANEPFNASRYAELCENCRWYKLSYKMDFKTATPDGKITYYGHMVNQALS